MYVIKMCLQMSLSIIAAGNFDVMLYRNSDSFDLGSDFEILTSKVTFINSVAI